MPPTIEEYSQSTASSYEKHFYAHCINMKVHDWITRHGLGGFKASVPIGESCPPDLKIDIIYEDKEKEDE